MEKFPALDGSRPAPVLRGSSPGATRPLSPSILQTEARRVSSVYPTTHWRTRRLDSTPRPEPQPGLGPLTPPTRVTDTRGPWTTPSAARSPGVGTGGERTPRTRAPRSGCPRPPGTESPGQPPFPCGSSSCHLLAALHVGPAQPGSPIRLLQASPFRVRISKTPIPAASFCSETVTQAYGKHNTSTGQTDAPQRHVFCSGRPALRHRSHRMGCALGLPTGGCRRLGSPTGGCRRLKH